MQEPKEGKFYYDAGTNFEVQLEPETPEPVPVEKGLQDFFRNSAIAYQLKQMSLNAKTWWSSLAFFLLATMITLFEQRGLNLSWQIIAMALVTALLVWLSSGVSLYQPPPDAIVVIKPVEPETPPVTDRTEPIEGIEPVNRDY